MRRLAILLLPLVVVCSAWEDYDGDDYYWNPAPSTRPPQSWPPSTTRPTSPSTRRTTTVVTTTFRPQEYRPGPDECDQPRANQIANRIFDQLMRQANGNPMTALVQLEARFNIRVQPGSSPYERLETVLSAATARMSAAGYGYYRPVMHAVADRLADAMANGGTINVNVRPAQGNNAITATVTISASNNNRPGNNRHNSTNWWSDNAPTTQRTTTTTTRQSGWWRQIVSRDLEWGTPGAGYSEQGTPGPAIGASEQVTPKTDGDTPDIWEMLMVDRNSLVDYHPQPVVD